MKIRPWKALALRSWRKTIRPILAVVLVLSAFRSAVADWNDVPTGSMKPTILEGDRIFVNKLAYDLKVPFTAWRIWEWSGPQRGDVVICYSPEDGTRLVKRVVGLPGDRVELAANGLIINGTPATYAALDQDTIDQIPTDQQPLRRFAAEKIDGQPHPIMTTPARPAMRSFEPVAVPPGHYLVLGDNRDESRDSRFFGFVDRAAIVGRASTVVLSLDPEHHYLPRWDRFFRGLP